MFITLNIHSLTFAHSHTQICRPQHSPKTYSAFLHAVELSYALVGTLSPSIWRRDGAAGARDAKGVQ